MPLGEPWRAGKRPYGKDTLPAAAACLKRFYLHLAGLGINRELGGQPADAVGGPVGPVPGDAGAPAPETASEPAGATPGPAPAPGDAAR